jgi:hypothetical protein
MSSDGLGARVVRRQGQPQVAGILVDEAAKQDIIPLVHRVARCAKRGISPRRQPAVVRDDDGAPQASRSISRLSVSIDSGLVLLCLKN